MRSKERVLVILREAFLPLHCEPDLADYNSKIGFRVFNPEGVSLIKYEPTAISNLLSGQGLETVINAVRNELESRGIALNGWIFSSENFGIGISFPGKFAQNPSTFGVNFAATVDGEQITCHVTTEALQDIEPPNAQAGALAQFTRHRSRFEEIAESKIRSQYPAKQIDITSSDVYG